MTFGVHNQQQVDRCDMCGTNREAEAISKIVYHGKDKIVEIKYCNDKGRCSERAVQKVKELRGE